MDFEPNHDVTLFKELRHFVGFIKASKALRIATYIMGIYYFVITISFVIAVSTHLLDTTIFSKDFRVFYTAVHILFQNPEQLYMSPEYELPFRYLPMFAYLFTFIQFFPFEIAYILHNLIMMAIYFINCFLVYELCVKFYKIDSQNKNLGLFMFYFIMAPLQVPNYILGQINSLFMCILLLALVFFENARLHVYKFNHNDLWGGLMVGVAITFKPIAVLVLPFLLPITVNFHLKPFIYIDFKTIFNRLLGTSLFLLPNLFILIAYSNLFTDFITINFAQILEFHQSTSLTRLILKLNTLWIISNSIPTFTILMFIIAGILYIGPYIYYLTSPRSKPNLTFYFTYSMLILLLAYPDSWFLYLLFFFAFLIPPMLQMEQQFNMRFSNAMMALKQLVKYLQIYFFVGVILHYVILGFDPITPMMVLGIYILLMFLHRKFQKEEKIEDSQIISEKIYCYH
jgi:hypothetical protein